MNSLAGICGILNAGGAAWAFDALARRLSVALGIPVVASPQAFNYLLAFDDDPQECGASFIPLAGIRLASDKRLLAEAFQLGAVPTPRTYLVDSLADAERIRSAEPAREWCLKYPTGCGAGGHRLLTPELALPAGWPTPLVVQEFVRLDRPEVYRLYAAGGRLFGWVARRFPADTRPSPWVAHARGARYEPAGDAPDQAADAAQSALTATGLLDSFGCVDLLRRPTGEWVVLEVGTDGLFNHVDRDLGLPDREAEIDRRVAAAFWKWAGTP